MVKIYRHEDDESDDDSILDWFVGITYSCGETDRWPVTGDDRLAMVICQDAMV